VESVGGIVCECVLCVVCACVLLCEEDMNSNVCMDFVCAECNGL
jgi:hypothetical protein